MKKKVLTATLIIISSLIILLTYKKDNNVTFSDTSKNNNNILSIMLETSSGSGNYQESLSNTFPTNGYIFNENLSNCENGSKISWNEENKSVSVKSNKADKCYLYFDVYEPTLAEAIINLYTGTQGENSIYYHDSNLTNGANDNSYRYAGSDPDNYVCFGSDDATCPNDNLYRIIGVFDGKVKLVKYDYANSNLLGTNGDYKSGSTASSSYYIGKNSSTNVYYWNYQSDTSINQSHGSNTWSTSLLNKINLNTNYLNNIGSKWANMIDTVVWKVGGNTQANLANVNVINAYKNEIINPTSTITCYAKIGLMYISDYGFSADPSCWTTTLSSFYNNNSTNKVWMFMGYSEYTLTPSTTSEDGVMGIAMTGAVSSYTASVDNAIRPVFYLNTNVKMLSGDGTKTIPYRVG